MNVARCNSPSCGARILWVKTITGAWAPIDAEPSDEGNIVLMKRTEADSPMALVVTGKRFLESETDVMRRNGLAFYTDHHATCADVEAFRDTGPL